MTFIGPARRALKGLVKYSENKTTLKVLDSRVSQLERTKLHEQESGWRRFQLATRLADSQYHMKFSSAGDEGERAAIRNEYLSFLVKEMNEPDLDKDRATKGDIAKLSVALRSVLTAPQKAAASGAQTQWQWFQTFCHWLAGARTETLSACPRHEQDRIAVIGMTVLVPTMMAFIAMELYITQAFGSHPILGVLVSIVWALAIMTIDRMLLATYRPFQPFFRRVGQIVLRFSLAGACAIAITHPFCVHLFRPLIEKQLLEQEFARINADSQTGSIAPGNPQVVQLSEGIDELKRNIANTDQEIKTNSSQIRILEGQIEEQKQNTIYAEAQANKEISGANGKPQEGKKGEQYRRDKQHAADAQRTENELISKKKLAEATSIELNDTRQVFDGRLSDKRRDLKTIQEDSEKRKSDPDTASNKALKAQNDQYSIDLKAFKDAENGNVSYRSRDPATLTIGLVRGIMTPEAGEKENWKPMAGGFQYLIVFLVLFLVDTIPIIAKVYSRPGPYDVLIEVHEHAATENLKTFKQEYHSGDPWNWVYRGEGMTDDGELITTTSGELASRNVAGTVGPKRNGSSKDNGRREG